MTLKVRYAEIDGQRVVFNSRYLEYADVGATEYWAWSGIGAAVGEDWHAMEFHVRHAGVDYLRPLVLGDVVEISVRLEALGGSSMALRMELANAAGELCAVIAITSVAVDLATGRPRRIDGAVRLFIAGLIAAQPDRIA